MANEIKWATTLGSQTTLIAGASSAPTLKNLSAAAGKLGNAITGNRNRYCTLELMVRFASSPAAGGYVDIYLLPSIDATNFSDGADAVLPPGLSRVASVPVRAVSTQQRFTIPNIELPPLDFKALIVNNASTGFTNTDNENVLSYRPYNEEIQ